MSDITKRSTTNRNRHRAYLRRGKPPCALCGEDIDYTLPYRDPGAFVVDHIVPIIRGGADELGNVQATHRLCNAQKYDKVASETAKSAAPAAPRTYVTWRTW
ncbi:HNH endonuclease signature motif containing protein [Nocardia sp. NPDC049190]|uniref:HNH endonuclease n=1 Tax=Nocardia sp. NPDC049190 TaxID=3155650 RepID=UPI0033FBB1FA